MDYQVLIPSPDAIPAPAWLFIVLEQLLFLLHLIVINAVVGGAFILLFKRLAGKGGRQLYEVQGPIAKKLPVMVALGINFAIPPLLFLQVVYGHLFYSSSVLMASYWILIIPLLILAYYGTYVHAGQFLKRPLLSKFSLILAVIILLYVALMLVSNNALMEQPEKWTAYFGNRGGSILDFSDVGFWPRFFHFLAASLAVGGLLYSIVHQLSRGEDPEKTGKVRNGLMIFAVATAIQILVGFWYLLAIPRDIMLGFMGGDLPATIILMLGIVLGISAMVFAFLGKLKLTIIHTLMTIAVMIVTRFNLRMMYLADDLQLSKLELHPQYGILALFLVVLLAGLAAIFYMLKVGFNKTNGRAVK